MNILDDASLEYLGTGVYKITEKSAPLEYEQLKSFYLLYFTTEGYNIFVNFSYHKSENDAGELVL